MKRKEFEHAIRAAGAVLGTDEVLVIGSQALHASVRDELPEEAGQATDRIRAKIDAWEGQVS